MAQALRGSTKEAVEAAEAEGAPVGRTYAPGSEPVLQTPPEDINVNVNPFSSVPHARDFDIGKTKEILAALMSEDFGAARRIAYGDADIGIHDRLPTEVANPVTDLASLPDRAAEQLERQVEINKERAEAATKPSAAGPPSKPEEVQEDATAAQAGTGTKGKK